MVKSNINQAAISSYMGMGVFQFSGDNLVTKDNMHFVYANENKIVREFNPAVKAAPQIFNYYTMGEDGSLSMERTNVVAENQFVSVDSYCRDDKEWSTMEVLETKPEGVLVTKFHIPAGSYVGHDDVSVNFSLISNETLVENGFETGKFHPASCRGKNLQSIQLLTTKLESMDEEQLVQFVANVPRMDMKYFYNQLLTSEAIRKEEEETQKSVARR